MKNIVGPGYLKNEDAPVVTPGHLQKQRMTLQMKLWYNYNTLIKMKSIVI
jgi:hypothetical protein